MVDIASALFVAGLGLAQKLIYRWITEGKSRIKVADVDAQIASQSKEEADRLRLRVDDLEKATQSMLRRLVTEMPGLSYAKPPLHSSSLVLDFNPRDPRSSKNLLEELSTKVNQMTLSAHVGVPPEPSGTQNPMPDGPPVGTASAVPSANIVKKRTAEPAPTMSVSAQMLSDLKRKVEDAEDQRR